MTCVPVLNTVQANTCDSNKIRRIVSRVDYVGRHYALCLDPTSYQIKDKKKYGIVQKVLNETQRLVKECLSNATDKDYVGRLKRVDLAFKQAFPPDKIHRILSLYRKDIIRDYGLLTSPEVIPNLKKGKKIYKTICSQCHGAKGAADTAAAAALPIKPTAFTDPKVLKHLSPYQMYNTVTDGIPGTNMVDFMGITEVERWAAVNWIMQKVHERHLSGSNKMKSGVYIPWKNAMNLSNTQLRQEMKALRLDAKKEKAMIAQIRSMKMYQNKALQKPLTVLYETQQAFKEAKESVRNVEISKARQIALEAYFDHFKTIETWLNTWISNNTINNKESADKAKTILNDFQSLMEKVSMSFSKINEEEQLKLLDQIIFKTKRLSQELLKKA